MEPVVDQRMVNLLFRGSGLSHDAHVSALPPSPKDFPRQEILIPRETLAKRIGELGAEITEAYRGEECLVIPVMDGAMLFAADLIREITLPLRIAPIKASSYGNSRVSSGKVSLPEQLPEGIRGSSILLVDDILDTGTTFDILIERLLQEGAREVKTCVLLRKACSRDRRIDYVGFDIPDVFIVGYGLDLAGYGRNLPHIACLGESPATDHFPFTPRISPP